MANCSSCSKDVGCGCNLVDGKCLSCISKDTPTVSLTAKPRVRYTAPKREVPPLTGFEEILNTPNIPKEEKLRRINEILEKARQQYLT